jgi:orotidine-5'-phosphate decarboxylase
MNYLDLLRRSSDRFGSLVCLGLDPVLENIPLEGSPGERILEFYETMISRMVSAKVCPSAVKPNYAFYAQYGLEGISALKKVIDVCREAGLPVILDVKRGDIGTTARAYAGEAYDFFGADAVTLSPYMGYDSIGPFAESYPHKGAYILTKTSNASSGEVQDIAYEGAPLYEYIAKKILDWHFPGIGSVVGATYPEQLERISSIYIASGKDVPLLIPGVGTQGGSLEAVMRALKAFSDIRIHRINSSSAINYAWKKKKGLHYADAALEALKELNDDIGALR